ncbi:MAG TPA: hypothetical protein VLC98_17320 [Phnomibacter sp.]|nr:hypothetical protein [Phnomibacter sp.]
MKVSRIILFALLSSCVIDQLYKIAIVKNDASYDISVIYTTQSEISDEELFYMGTQSVPAKAEIVVNGNSTGEGLYFFFFNEDSVYKYIKSGQKQGIVKQSFLKKVFHAYDDASKIDTIIYKP